MEIDSPYLIITCDISWPFITLVLLLLQAITKKHEDHKDTRYRLQAKAKPLQGENQETISSLLIESATNGKTKTQTLDQVLLQAPSQPSKNPF